MGLRFRLLIVVGLALSLGACDTNLGGDDPVPPSSESLPEDAMQLPLEGSGPTISDEPVKPDGRHRLFAISGEVEEGQRYIFELDARCGIGYRVDFDGRLWEAVDRPKELRGTTTIGTMTLVNNQLAQFENSSGERVRFIRFIGKKFAHPCEQE